VTGARCVMSDSPMALIELDVLDRDLRHGCPNWIDVTGQAFRLGLGNHRKVNLRWQRRFTRYLLSGDRLTLFRPANTGISRELHYIIVSLPRLALAHHFGIFDSSRPWSPRTRRLYQHLMTHRLAPPPVP
jgi:hypothetical protein